MVQVLSLRLDSQGKGKVSPGASASKQPASPAPVVHTGSSKAVGSTTPRVEEPVTPAQNKPGKKQVSSLPLPCLAAMHFFEQAVSCLSLSDWSGWQMHSVERSTLQGMLCG